MASISRHAWARSTTSRSRKALRIDRSSWAASPTTTTITRCSISTRRSASATPSDNGDPCRALDFAEAWHHRGVSERRRHDIVLAFALVIAALPILAFHFFPSTDGPEHLDVTAILGARRTPMGSRLREVFHVRTGVSPYATVYTILGPLSRMTSPETAEKILLVAYLVGGALAFRFA